MIAQKEETEQKLYKRLDRHVRTAATLNELNHWVGIWMRGGMSRLHHSAIRVEIESRLLHLTGGDK